MSEVSPVPHTALSTMSATSMTLMRLSCLMASQPSRIRDGGASAPAR